MAAVQTNGEGLGPLAKYTRWHNAPIATDVPIGGAGEVVELNLQDLEDPTEMIQMLEDEKVERKYWVTIALAYAQKGQLDHALEVLQNASRIHSRATGKDRLQILGCMSWVYLLKSRQAPRTVAEGQEDMKTKEHYLREATNVMNEATRINPAYPPLYLTRGTLNLLRAALATSTKTGPGADQERLDCLNTALKSFDEALRLSSNKNLLAWMGRARTLYLLKRFQLALTAYQQVLSKNPHLTDPDPRIGIGACFWQLGYPDQAKNAWSRAVALNPKSNVGHTLLAIALLREASKFPSEDRQFQLLYTEAISKHVNIAYKLEKNSAFNNAIFANYFLNTKRWDQMDALANKAIQQTDVNAVASDGWFVRARKEHALGNYQAATEAYSRADQARGGQNAGYFPAKFGMVQLILAQGDVAGAKFRLEKLFERHKSFEIMTLLGYICAEEVFMAQKANPKEDRSKDIQKAIRLLEAVRRNWKDEKAKVKWRADPAVLLLLARLYESESPLESEKCLAEVENIQRQNIADENDFDPAAEDFNELIQEHMPPALHNNIGCFYYRDEAYEQAAQRFEIALNATLKTHEKQLAERQKAEEAGENTSDLAAADTDALVTTISYNLARTQEALGLKDIAVKTYQGLINRHSDYSDAIARLAYISLIEAPQGDGPKKIKAMYEADPSHLEIRTLMGWYYHMSKKKTVNIVEDQEFRHHKHTLQQFDKHDLYALIAMGNIHLTIARDMPRSNDQEKEKRSKMYQKGYEFFDKALQLDPRDAYAAQGVAVALCDDKKAYSEALQIFVKVKDTIRDVATFQNLGHVYAETKQYSRSIENYEAALKKQIQLRAARHAFQSSTNGETQPANGANGDAGEPDHKEDAQLYAWLSRVWLQRGKSDRNILSHTTSLELMRRALATQPESPHLRFNVAYIQFQIVQLVNSLPETARTLDDLNSAKEGLEEAIATFESVAQEPHPPYPRSMLEQRAAMSKGTMMKQIERAIQQQSDYETANSEKLAEAKRRREAELKARDDAARRRAEEEEAKEAEVRKKREQFMAEAAAKAEEFRQAALIREAADYTTDEETGERHKREKKKRGDGKRSKKRKQRDDEDGFIEHDEDSDEGEGGFARDRTPLSASEGEGASKEQPKKKRRLERKGKKEPKAKKEKVGKFKSQAVVVDSDESEDEAVATPARNSSPGNGSESPAAAAGDDDVAMDTPEPARAPRQRKQLRTIADDDEENDDDDDAGPPPPSAARSENRVIDDDDDE